MKFTKMHGCGNDYVYVNGFTEKVADKPKTAHQQKVEEFKQEQSEPTPEPEIERDETTGIKLTESVEEVVENAPVRRTRRKRGE